MQIAMCRSKPVALNKQGRENKELVQARHHKPCPCACCKALTTYDSFTLHTSSDSGMSQRWTKPILTGLRDVQLKEGTGCLLAINKQRLQQRAETICLIACCGSVRYRVPGTGIATRRPMDRRPK